MSWKLLNTRTMPVGIDLGTGSVKLAQLRRADGELELSAVASSEVPFECRSDPRAKLAFLAQSLPGLLRSGGFSGRECVLSLPATETFVQHVKVANLPPDRLAGALRSELRGKSPFDPADAVIRHVVAGQTYGDGEVGLEVIVLAAARGVIEGYLSVARKAKLRVRALNVEPCAILECFARLFRREGDSKKVTLFLDLGRAVTQVVVAHGARLVFARNVPLGAEQVERAMGTILGMTEDQMRGARLAEALARAPEAEADRLYEALAPALSAMSEEISRCLRYYESVFTSRPVERVLFLGGQALDRRFCQRLAQGLNLPGQIGDPLARIKSSRTAAEEGRLDRRHPQPAWAVAVGLSLGADYPGAA